jgi:hypothetical protein
VGEPAAFFVDLPIIIPEPPRILGFHGFLGFLSHLPTSLVAMVPYSIFENSQRTSELPVPPLPTDVLVQ